MIRTCSALTMAAALATALWWSGQAGAATVDVTPGNMGAWSLVATQDNSNAPGGHGTADIVSGPATPPLGTGSAHLATASGYGGESAQLNYSGATGININDLTTLSYSTYCTASNDSPPSQDTYLTMYINTSGDSNGSYDDRLIFEPIYSDGGDVVNPNGNQPAPAFDTWQNWNLLQGMWYSDNYGGPGSNALSWSQILADEGANAVVVSYPGIGDIRIAAGFASPTDNFDVNVDAFSIGTASGTTTYNFDPVPEPTSLGLLMLGGLPLLRRRRHMHSAA